MPHNRIQSYCYEGTADSVIGGEVRVGRRVSIARATLSSNEGTAINMRHVHEAYAAYAIVMSRSTSMVTNTII